MNGRGPFPSPSGTRLAFVAKIGVPEPSRCPGGPAQDLGKIAIGRISPNGSPIREDGMHSRVPAAALVALTLAACSPSETPEPQGSQQPSASPTQALAEAPMPFQLNEEQAKGEGGL